jgi:hypothetical protein
MFLSTYDFDGDPATLLPAYDRFIAASHRADALLLHVCVVREGGITIYDACPSREVFEDFSQSAQFAEAIAAAGLPRPRTTPRGEVHLAHLSQAVKS